jgi:hypothetical protein
VLTARERPSGLNATQLNSSSGRCSPAGCMVRTKDPVETSQSRIDPLPLEPPRHAEARRAPSGLKAKRGLKEAWSKSASR